jgi:hypothetical protein
MTQILSGCVALLIQLPAEFEAMNRTGQNAQPATLALVAGNPNISPIGLFLCGFHGLS